MEAGEYLGRRFANEEVFRRAIERFAGQLGFLVHHHVVSQLSSSGFPDLVIVGYGRMWVIETKGPRGRISEMQRRWVEELVACGVDARFLWSSVGEDFEVIRGELEAAYAGRFGGGG